MRSLSMVYNSASLTLFGIIIIFTACQSLSNPEQEIIEEKSYPLADLDLWPHFTKFEEEAAQRGLNFDLRALEITGIIEDIPSENVAGTCQYGIHIHKVTVDENFWRNSSHLIRELVVFHELGHCVLFQDHRDGSDGRGNCLSLMNSGTTDCLVPVSYTHLTLPTTPYV